MRETTQGVLLAESTIAAAETCRREAEAMVGEPPYGGLAGQPSSWCVVTKKKGHSAYVVFHTPLDEASLRAHIESRDKVVLIVGLVVSRDAAHLNLNPYNHVASISIAKPMPFSAARMARISNEAKARAALAITVQQRA
jgi:hypothetical protein